MKILYFAEFKKLKRDWIVPIGLIASIVCFVISYFQFQMVGGENYSIQQFSQNVIWNSITLTTPFGVALIGGHLINKEYIEDTQKNLLLVPIEWHQIIKSKIMLLFTIAIFMGIFEFAGITCIGIVCNFTGITIKNELYIFISVEVIKILLCVGLLPIILFFSQIKGRYIWGAILAMVIGVGIIFISNGKLVNIYPITAGFSLIHFKGINSQNYNLAMSIITIIFYCFLSYCIYSWSYKRRI